jgi:ABC-2 type transport system ATP-binding protein
MVELHNIKFGYKKNRTLFDNLNLDLQPGFIYGLLGKNGAGKSSLLKLICGLLYQNDGEVKVLGYDAQDRRVPMLQDVYLVPEEFELPGVTLQTYVKLNAVFYSKFNHDHFAHYLKEFEIPLNSKLSNMSYGQKKKFLIAFGLATNARVLIFDEPTNGLDIPSKSQFRKIVVSALDEDKLFIISTHQVRDLDNLIDNIVILENGRVIFNRNVAEISEKLGFEYNLTGIPESEILYSEEMQGRRAGIVRNFSGEETRLDLELLFNGIVKNAESINEQLNYVNHENGI